MTKFRGSVIENSRQGGRASKNKTFGGEEKIKWGLISIFAADQTPSVANLFIEKKNAHKK